jgi:DNA-3-methyladenine glycosylase II
MPQPRSSGNPSSNGNAVSSRQIEKSLAKLCPVLGNVIHKHGPCTITRKRGGFDIVCRMIVFQQLSGKAANTIWERFRALCPRKKVTPAAIAKITDQQMREAGLSRQKIGYIRNLVAHVSDGSLDFGHLSAQSDEYVVEHLTQVKGIGQWTAEMYLMFVLGRPDVFSAGDLGLRTAVKKLYGVKRKNFDYTKFAERWSPYRTVASWYLWRSLENE